MKNLFQNKYFLIGITLMIGVLIGWVVKPSSSNNERTAHEHTIDENGVWTCSMHPQIQQKEPGSCPLCGMALIPLEEDEGEGDPLSIKMSATAVQLANIVTQKVSKGSLGKQIILTGKVMEDERSIVTQSSHIPGRIESLNVSFTGDYVSKGQTIATVYSPTLVTAQQELFETQKLASTQPALFEAAKRKLANWKLTDTQIEEFLQSKKLTSTFPILAETSGYVKEKMINEGDYIRQGSSLYSLSDLSDVWVLFDAYETDLQWIRTGDMLEFTIASLPGVSFDGKISYIDPVIDPKTRVASLRVELKNDENLLKPEMLASGRLTTELNNEEALLVPKTAIMWTGKRSIVYVKTASEKGVAFNLREITLGPDIGDQYLVTEGLEEGEEIAVNGTFSIDAAAQLAGKPSMMNPQGGNPTTGHAHHGGMVGSAEVQKSLHPEVNISTEKFESSAVFKQQLKAVFQAYLPLKDALVETDAVTAKEKVTPLLDAIEKVDMMQVANQAHEEWMKDLDVLMKTTQYMIEESDVEKIRGALSPLSDQLYQTLVKFDVETGGYRQYCPMAFDYKGAFWLSDAEEILNPYFGDEMLTCGNVEEELK